MQVVQWFVERNCKAMELCLALTAAASRSHVNIVAYLLSHVPQNVLQTLGAEILKVFSWALLHVDLSFYHEFFVFFLISLHLVVVDGNYWMYVFFHMTTFFFKIDDCCLNFFRQQVSTRVALSRA
jgi:hypothetical protein